MAALSRTIRLPPGACFVSSVHLSKKRKRFSSQLGIFAPGILALPGVEIMQKPKENKNKGPHPKPVIRRTHPSGPFTASDLPIDAEGRIYHLQLKPDQIAPDILIVGDPGRAEFIGSKFFRELEIEHQHRGLHTVTGTSALTGEQVTMISPSRTTVATSGIGTPSLEIVVGELVALNEIDFETRRRKASFPRLHILRVGTSGGLQPATQLGTPIITTFAIGLDNTGLYYEAPYSDPVCQRLEQELEGTITEAMSKFSRFHGAIHPYVARAAPELVRALIVASERLGIQAKAGLTTSSPGFFAPQGRDITRMQPTVPDLDKILSEFDPRLDGQRIENFEMEASFLIHFMGGLGHWAGAICAAIANRRQNTFADQYQEAIENATRIALLALATARKDHPDIQLG